MERKKVLTEIEYNILDELYFVTSYGNLKEESGYDDNQLRLNLIELIKKGFVKVYRKMDEEIEEDNLDMENSFDSYLYLASKKGLFEHNSR